MAIYEELLQGGGKAGRVPQFWDGKAAVRIADTIHAWMQNGCTTL